MATATQTRPDELLTLKDASKMLGLSVYMTMKESSLGRITAVALPGIPVKFERHSVEARAAELGKPAAVASK